MFSLLFADDDAGMRALVSRALAPHFHVEVAAGGHEALQILSTSSTPFAVLIADMSMGRGSGRELLKAARNLAPETARVLLTGDHRLIGDENLAHETGLFRCLLKPVNLPTLFATANAALAWHVGASRALAA